MSAPEAADLPPAIRLEAVEVVSGDFRLPPIDLTIGTNEYVLLTGPSGVGKTTLLEAVCGLKRVIAGYIFIAGRDVTALPPAERDLGLAPQDNALFATMSVRENLKFGLRMRGDCGKNAEGRVEEIAQLLRLTPLLDRSTAGLSGGEAKRVALGRAAAASPPVLLLDEPLTGLDAPLREEVRHAIAAAARFAGAAVLHVSHDASAAEGLATRTLHLTPHGVLEEKPAG